MAKVETLSNVIIRTVDSFQDHRGQLFTLWEKSDFDFLNFMIK